MREQDVRRKPRFSFLIGLFAPEVELPREVAAASEDFDRAIEDYLRANGIDKDSIEKDSGRALQFNGIGAGMRKKGDHIVEWWFQHMDEGVNFTLFKSSGKQVFATTVTFTGRPLGEERRLGPDEIQRVTNTVSQVNGRRLR